MNANFLKSKIKICIIGTGEWGKKVAESINLINRYELLGQINTSTSEDTKNSMLEKADMWYIATPSNSQIEYINAGLEQNKHIICESPVCETQIERKLIYEKLVKNAGNKKIFYCNFPYFLDQDFAKLMSGGLLKKAKFFSIKCSGPKFKNDPEKAKKFYINQAFNLVFNTVTFLSQKGFDKFVVDDNFSGQFYAKDITYVFEWGYNEEPKLELTIKGEDYSKSGTFIYDKYDQIVPLLLMFSDKILHSDESIPENYIKAADAENNDFLNILSVSSFLAVCSAEYFSDIFCKLNGSGCNISDPSKLFLNGGFNDLNYSIIENQS